MFLKKIFFKNEQITKKFLIWSQVLGLGALSATACTDNNTQTATTSSSADNNTKANKKPDTDPQNPTVNQTVVISDNKDEPNTIKAKGIKLGSDIAKGAADGLIGGIALSLSKHDPKHAGDYLGVGEAIDKHIDQKINTEKEKLLEKEAEKQAAKKAKELHDEKEGHKNLLDKVKDLFHHDKDDKDTGEGNTQP